MVDYSTDLPHGTAHPDPPGQPLRRVGFLGAELLRDNPVVEGPRQGNHAGYLQDGALSPPALPVPVSAGKQVVHRRPELASRLAERLDAWVSTVDAEDGSAVWGGGAAGMTEAINALLAIHEHFDDRVKSPTEGQTLTTRYGGTAASAGVRLSEAWDASAVKQTNQQAAAARFTPDATPGNLAFHRGSGVLDTITHTSGSAFRSSPTLGSYTALNLLPTAGEQIPTWYADPDDAHVAALDNLWTEVGNAAAGGAEDIAASETLGEATVSAAVHDWVFGAPPVDSTSESDSEEGETASGSPLLSFDAADSETSPESGDASAGGFTPGLMSALSFSYPWQSEQVSLTPMPGVTGKSSTFKRAVIAQYITLNGLQNIKKAGWLNQSLAVFVDPSQQGARVIADGSRSMHLLVHPDASVSDAIAAIRKETVYELQYGSQDPFQLHDDMLERQKEAYLEAGYQLYILQEVAIAVAPGGQIIELVRAAEDRSPVRFLLASGGIYFAVAGKIYRVVDNVGDAGQAVSRARQLVEVTDEAEKASLQGVKWLDRYAPNSAVGRILAEGAEHGMEFSGRRWVPLSRQALDRVDSEIAQLTRRFEDAGGTFNWEPHRIAYDSNGARITGSFDNAVAGNPVINIYQGGNRGTMAHELFHSQQYAERGLLGRGVRLSNDPRVRRAMELDVENWLRSLGWGPVDAADILR